jgi:hypothetical protein
MTQLVIPMIGDPVSVELGEISRQLTGHAAISLCARKSGLLDKIIAADLHMQEATWSRVQSGGANLSLENLSALMDRCGNEAPLHWLLLRRGYDPRSLRKLETETECRLREAEEALAAERLKVRVLTDALRGGPSA